MKSIYQEKQRKKSIELIKNSTLFERKKAGKKFMRAEQLIKNKEKETVKAENFLHIHVIPTENSDLLNKIYGCSRKDLENTWKSHLKDKTKYIIISPEKLLSNSLLDKKYDQLRNYLTERYW